MGWNRVGTGKDGSGAQEVGCDRMGAKVVCDSVGKKVGWDSVGIGSGR